MRIFLSLLVLLLSGAGLFAQHSNAAATPKIVSGAVLLNDKAALDVTKLVGSLKSAWKLAADSVHTSDKTTVFTVPGATVMIATLDYPVSPAEIEAPALISWLWKTAPAEIAAHQSQVVISVIGTEGKALELYQLFTKVAAGVLENSNSCGVFMSAQYLVVSKPFYIAAAKNMLNSGSTPVYCWIYFGMTKTDGKPSGYTYGLQEFGLLDMEIVASSHSNAEIQSVLYDATTSVIQRKVMLKDGMVFDGVPDAQLPVKVGPSALIKGETTAKLGY